MPGTKPRKKTKPARKAKPIAAPPPPNPAYERHREAMAARSGEKSRKGRDIAPIPPVANPERRARCERNLETFCREYFPLRFSLAWSPAHRTAIEKLEVAVTTGALFALAMPRGSGKTSLAEAATLWALLYGKQEFTVIVASDAGHAEQVLASLKIALERNDALLEDFPEVCWPIRRMEGIAQRANGQLCDGKRTNIGWAADEIVFPTIDGSRASGAIVRATGITGAGIRGNLHTRADGRTVRPGLVLLEDPQTDESAKSPSQVADRERLINGAVLGMAGPGQRIAAILLCTVIAPDDLSDRMLNRTLNPLWQGERTRMVDGWPKRDDLWEQFRKLRDDGLRAGSGRMASDAFYLANREAMDEGASATWAARKDPEDVSALQHAMLLYFKLGRAAFFAEYQNEPVASDRGADELTAQQIADKAIGLDRGIVPREATRLVAFVDVQKELLFWAVLALQDDFTGHVVDYGSYPDQKREWFAKIDVRRTLMAAEKAARFEEGIRRGLDSLAGLLIGREWKREDGSVASIERCLVDAHWGYSTEIVKTFCRQSPYAATLMPSFGMFIGASSNPLNERPKKPGERRGRDWRIPLPGNDRTRHVLFDANSWKTFLMERFRQVRGGSGSFSLFGESTDHRLLADHLTAEYPVLTTGRGRAVTEWKQRPNRPDNDWLDCLTGCCVAGSVAGAGLNELPVEKPPVRQHLRLSDLQRMAKHHG